MNRGRDQTDLPLGLREGRHLEFKRGEALEDLSTIGREVVGMLNDDGGEVWVGVDEQEGRATEITGIEAPERQRRRLHDFLVDAIEPSPDNDELRVEIRQVPEGESLLRLSIAPQDDRKPYALLKGAGRLFVVRVGDRNRPMSREEILAPEAGSGRVDRRDELHKEFLEARKDAQRHSKEALWLHMGPERDVEIDIQGERERFERLFRIADLSDSRPTGWTFINPYRSAEIRAEKFLFDGIEIQRNGWLTFELPLQGLHWKGEDNELYPLALLEYPVSSFRLAAHIYSDSLQPEDTVLADAAMFGLEGWALRPHSPESFGYMRRITTYEESQDLVWEKPLAFSFEEISNDPDRCAYRLVIRRVYEAFGYWEDEIPAEFDRDEGRLMLKS